MNDHYSTKGAYDFAADKEKKPLEIESNWWQFFSDYRLRCWKEEIDELIEMTGISLLDVCRYLGVTYSKGIGFYDKLPKKRSMYIGGVRNYLLNIISETQLCLGTANNSCHLTERGLFYAARSSFQQLFLKS